MTIQRRWVKRYMGAVQDREALNNWPSNSSKQPCCRFCKRLLPKHTHVVAQLQEHFVNNPAHGTTNGLMHLIPQKCVASGGVPSKELAEAVEYYSGDLPHPRVFLLSMRFGQGSGNALMTPRNYQVVYLKSIVIVVEYNFPTSNLYYK